MPATGLTSQFLHTLLSTFSMLEVIIHPDEPSLLVSTSFLFLLYSSLASASQAYAMLRELKMCAVTFTQCPPLLILLAARYSFASVRGFLQPFLFTDTWMVGNLLMLLMPLMMVLLPLRGFREVPFPEVLPFPLVSTLPLLSMAVAMTVPNGLPQYLIFLKRPHLSKPVTRNGMQLPFPS